MTAVKSILLVDDDDSHLQMLALHLRGAGFRVQTATGGPEALDLLSANSYDCMVTDAQMSPLSGFGLAAEASLLDPALRIIMISGANPERCVSGARIERYFSKPLPLDQFVAWISAPSFDDVGEGR
jgi:DNA-binding response OmpR family regulator